VALRL